MIHLTQAHYRRMPWANGRGTTVELLREDGLRLSMASVTEDGPFSIFPGVERSLTVLSGPGFLLQGDGITLPCAPLVPVAFPGDVPVSATNTGGIPSDDFNVMTARTLPRPTVTVEPPGATLPAGGRLFLFALAPMTVNGTALAKHDLVITRDATHLTGPVIAVRLPD